MWWAGYLETWPHRRKPFQCKSQQDSCNLSHNKTVTRAAWTVNTGTTVLLQTSHCLGQPCSIAQSLGQSCVADHHAVPWLWGACTAPRKCQLSCCPGVTSKPISVWQSTSQKTGLLAVVHNPAARRAAHLMEHWWWSIYWCTPIHTGMRQCLHTYTYVSICTHVHYSLFNHLRNPLNHSVLFY